MDTLIDQAIAFGSFCHAGQKRKYTGLPYIVHPIAVMQIIHGIEGTTEEMRVAAILHDVVEDTDVGVAYIERMFGPVVAGHVFDLTAQEVPGNRAVRKTAELERLKHVSAQSQTIKLADLLDNSLDIFANDQKFARIYLPEQRRLAVALDKGNEKLRGEVMAETYRSMRKLGMEMMI